VLARKRLPKRSGARTQSALLSAMVWTPPTWPAGRRAWRRGRRAFPPHAPLPAEDPATGELSGFGSVSRDLTVAKRAEAALRASEAKLSAVIEALPVGVGVTDASGRVLSIGCYDPPSK